MADDQRRTVALRNRGIQQAMDVMPRALPGPETESAEGGEAGGGALGRALVVGVIGGLDRVSRGEDFEMPGAFPERED